MIISKVVAVGVGGMLGSILRFTVGEIVIASVGYPRFPLATLIVNIVGCFLIGLIATASQHSQYMTSEARLFLITGILGGFTTFSAFGLESYSLLRAGNTTLAFLNISFQLIGGLAAVGLGVVTGSKFFIST